MSGLFEAIRNLKPVSKKYTVTIQKQQVEVTLEKKLEIQKVGEDKYMLEGKSIRLKPVSKIRRWFPEPAKQNKDPYWVETQERFEWQTPSE